MKKQIESLNLYLANLSVLNTKLHNLHWNVTGKNFEQVHLFLEKLYDDVFEKTDEVAERIKMLGSFPFASLKEYLNVATIQERSSEDISVKETISLVLDDYRALVAEIKALRLLAIEQDDFVTVALLESHVSGFEKTIWFLTQMQK
ncbi:MAG: DNA starvation/stationary phase protection protein [Candidatus Izemoplasmatales bacterium]|nr:DNA starvation/stationary phase protection protein [Candidatus Izemoplasmatales bacterium]